MSAKWNKFTTFAVNSKPMDNQYIKTFPHIMKGKTIMYVHGFGSAASTNTVALLQTLLPSARVIAEDIPLHPEEGIKMLRDMAEREKPDLIIGTSMGGMYTEMLRGYDRILVNPAFRMGDTMSEHGLTGKQVFHNPRKDGIQEFIVTKAMVKEYREMTSHCFQDITDDDRKHVYGLFGDEDPVVHTFDLFHENYPNAIRFHGEHRLTERVILRYLIPLIRQIDDAQEHRERPVVFIGIDAMRTDRGDVASCLNKAYDLLLQHYDIHIVAPSLTNKPDHCAETMRWIEDTLSAPAWNKVIFCNTPNLLLGDYYIDRPGHDDFMGTSIELGSDDFKTWEEIIVFFERIGGQ